MKNPQIEPRMYRETKETLGEKTTKDGFTVKKKTNKISYGVDTNAVTRKQMLDLLPEIVDMEYDKFVSPNIYHDLSTLEKKKTGKIEHSESGHDDSLMAYLIFRWAVFYGKCFRDKFGIAAVPSRMNVKIVSSQDNFLKIQSLIENMNKQALSESAFNNNPMYKQLAEQEQKLKTDENKQLNTFLRIANFNKY